MTAIIIEDKLTKDLVDVARKDYQNYIKVTIDLEKEIIAIGGEYHSDAEKVLIEKTGSESKNILGGGYDIDTKTFETNAMINIRPNLGNPSNEILDPQKREKFLQIAKNKLSNIESFI